MKLIRLATAFSLAITLSIATHAGDNQVSFGETSVTVRADDDFCAIDKAQPFDKAWLDIQVKANAGSNEVAGAYLLCDELAQLRQGVSLNPSRWVILLSPLQGGTKAQPVKGITRKQLVEALAVEFDKGVKVDVAEISENVNQAGESVLGTDNMAPIEISGTGVPSLLAKTDAGVYAGLQLQVATENGRTPVGAVIGITLVNDHMLSVNVYRIFDDPKTINTLLGEASVMIEDIVKLND